VTGIHTGASTTADILGFFASAMSAEVGLKVLSVDVTRDLQLLYRVKRTNCPDLPIAFCPRGEQIWIVHSKFMDGKHLNAEEASRRLREGSRSPDPGAGVEIEQAVPEDI
jgi:hypothetical protein